ncbi:MAG TPA: outer membrane beta-barrel protein [Flavobacteriales bacterium]|nr:outer membrane beta-barrel protein [Flavobacteriales bacterium]
MKKTLLFGLALLGFTMAKSQDADKNFRFGLKATPSINWFKIDDEKTFEKGGANLKFGYGLITEFKITDVAWFTTGLQVDYDGGKIEKNDSIYYLYNEDDGFLENDFDYIADTATTKKYTTYMLNKRKYNSMYVTIPLQLRLKTKEIGYLTYYGHFGLNTSIHIRTKVTDESTSWSSTGAKQDVTLEKLDNSKDMNILRTSLALGGGVEMNLSGSTSLMFGLSFNQGFMNAVKKDSKFLIDGEKTNASTETKPTAQQQKFLSQSMTLTIGILF